MLAINPRTISRHEEIIQFLVGEGAQRTGFHEEIKKTIAPRHFELEELEPHVSCNHCLIDQDIRQLHQTVVPDAFTIDLNRRRVICFEVEITHCLNEDKIAAYSDYWWVLDEFYWRLELIALDSLQNRRPIQLPLLLPMSNVVG